MLSQPNGCRRNLTLKRGLFSSRIDKKIPPLDRRRSFLSRAQCPHSLGSQGAAEADTGLWVARSARAAWQPTAAGAPTAETCPGRIFLTIGLQDGLTRHRFTLHYPHSSKLKMSSLKKRNTCGIGCTNIILRSMSTIKMTIVFQVWWTRKWEAAVHLAKMCGSNPWQLSHL